MGFMVLLKLKLFLKKYKFIFFFYILIVQFYWYLVRKKHSFSFQLLTVFAVLKKIIIKIKKKINHKIEKYYIRKIISWNFRQSFLVLTKYAKIKPELSYEIGNELIIENPYNAKGYALLAASLRAKPKEGHYDIALHSLSIGNRLIKEGKLEIGVEFYKCLKNIFPDIFHPYFTLYNLIFEKQKKYRSLTFNQKFKKKIIIISFSVWGDQYIFLFMNYSIPSMLAKGNIPKIAENRCIQIDIFTTLEDKNKIERHDNFINLKNFCNINFIIFPTSLIKSEEYSRNSDELRYMIYGGFHHLSIERARAYKADIMCLGPDNVHSNDSLGNYVKFLDEGYPIVLFTAIRGQAEFLEIEFDKLKNNNGTLEISANEMVNLSTKFIHHDFLKYIVLSDKVAEWQSQFFIPNKKGFYIRGFHLHPVVISSQVIKKQIDWDFSTADNTMIHTLFPNKKNWEKFKVICDSSEGIMIDMTYKQSGTKNSKVNIDENYLNKISNSFNNNHLWNFRHQIYYNTNKKIENISSFILDKNGNLNLVSYKISMKSKKVKKIIIDWYKKRDSNENNFIKPN